MRNILTLLFVVITSTLFAQAYKPMNGYYDWNGNNRFNDTVFFKDTVAFDSALLYQGASKFTIAPESGSGFSFLKSGGVEPIISSDPTGVLIINEALNDKVDVWVRSTNDTTLFIDASADGAVGIHTNAPETPLHIKGNDSADEVLITLENFEESTAATETATLENFPAGILGDPDVFLQINIVVGGVTQTAIVPLWLTP